MIAFSYQINDICLPEWRAVTSLKCQSKLRDLSAPLLTIAMVSNAEAHTSILSATEILVRIMLGGDAVTKHVPEQWLTCWG